MSTSKHHSRRSEVRPNNVCLLCGETGRPLYSGLRDRSFAAPGVWSILMCARCGLYWLDPLPAPEDMPKVYPSAYFALGEQSPSAISMKRAVLRASLGAGSPGTSADKMAAARFVSRSALLREQLLGSIAHLIGLPPGRLLDVGCGGGGNLAVMRSLGWDVVGVDPHPEAARAARAGHGIEIVTKTLAQAALPAESFDAVTLNHVIEHVEDPVALLLECRRVLKPGGRLVLMTPNMASLGRRAFGSAWLALEVPRHYVLFTPSSMGEAARRAGLSPVVLRTSARLAHLNWIGSWSIRRTGSFDLGADLSRPTAISIAGIFYQFLEQGLGAFTELGDDIVLVATRSES